MTTKIKCSLAKMFALAYYSFHVFMINYKYILNNIRNYNYFKFNNNINIIIIICT